METIPFYVSLNFAVAILEQKKETEKIEDNVGGNNNNSFSFATYPSRIVISCNRLHAIPTMTNKFPNHLDDSQKVMLQIQNVEYFSHYSKLLYRILDGTPTVHAIFLK